MNTPEVINNILAHYGAKGMKWGVRKSKSSTVTVTSKRKKLKTSGGHGHKAHPEAVRARTIGQVGKKSGVKALSNKELQEYTHRINAEGSFKRAHHSQKNAGARFVGTLLGQTGKNQLTDVSNRVASGQVKKAMASRLARKVGVAAAVA